MYNQTKQKTMKTNKNVIWDSGLFLDEKAQSDWAEDFADANDITSDEVSDDAWHDAVWDYLDDERANLSVPLDGDILCISQIGRWDGVHLSAGTIGNGNLSDCLSVGNDIESARFYCNRHDLVSEQTHHDGTNVHTYRLISAKQKARIQRHVEKYGFADERYLRRNSTSLRPAVAQVYGW